MDNVGYRLHDGPASSVLRSTSDFQETNISVKQFLFPSIVTVMKGSLKCIPCGVCACPWLLAKHQTCALYG